MCYAFGCFMAKKNIYLAMIVYVYKLAMNKFMSDHYKTMKVNYNI